jgi:hypothetical protein
MSRVPDIEYSALQALMESEKRATERGTIAWLALNPGVLEVVRHARLTSGLTRTHAERSRRHRTQTGDAAASASRRRRGKPNCRKDAGGR